MLRILALSILVVTASLDAADQWLAVNTASEPGLAGDDIQFIQEGPGERIWIGTNGGLTTYAGGAYQRFARTDGKPLGVTTWGVVRAGDGRIAISTARGVIRVSADRQETLLGYASVSPAVPYGLTGLWAIAKDASEVNVLMASDGGEWSAVDDYVGIKVVDLFAASDGAVWIVVDGNGLVRVDPKVVGDQAHLSGLNIQSVFEDRDGRIWAGRWGRGVVVQAAGAWTEHLTDEESAVVHIAQSTDGSMWFGTTAGGVWQYDGSAWTQHLATDGLISVLETTSDGRVWVSSQETRGLKYWDGSKWVLSLDSPLPIRCLVETSHGLWAGGVLDGLHILRGGGK